MGKRIKRGVQGNAAQYLTRNQAIKKLQLSLAQFRRICILKGIHPREPKKKVQGANKTYYHVKDINWLLHEPLLNTFRQIKAHQRKVRKAQAKLNPDLAKRLAALTPTYRLDHLIKERYPSFMDALRDMDDPLTMVHLFATLPAEKRYEIPRKQVDTARRLALEWQAFVVRSNSLRKVFVSVKGFYYQAEIMGQQVTWLVPHQLAQVLPSDVDYKVLLTFLEFYLTLLQFVNFKLYHTIGLRYPPSLDPRLEAASAELEAIMRDLAGLRDHSEAQFEAEEKRLLELEKSEAAQERLASLKDKLKELEGGEGAAAGSSDAEEEQQEEEEEDGGSDDALPDIDSGSDGEEEEEEDGSSDDEEQEEEEEQSEEEDAGPTAAAGAALKSAAAGAAAEEDEGKRAAGGALAVDASDDSAVCQQLFKGLVFYLAREVPREPLMFVIRAFGGDVAYDGEGSPYKEADEAVTHQVVDRPHQSHRFLSRQYVQPQWVFDSSNFRVLMPADMYAPGKVPPPHLSPFVDNSEEGYTPEFAETVKQLQEAAAAARKRAAGELPPEAGFVGEDAAAGALAVSEPVDEAEAAEKLYAAELAKELRAGEESEEEEEEEEQQQQQQPPLRKKKAAGEEESLDMESMKDIMMSRKTRKFYERIKRSQQGKRERVEVLEQRKAQLQKKQKK